MLRADARYHVTARANRKEMILESEQIKELFLEVVERCKKKYDFRIENFCIMGNHFHLIIRPGKGENLSAIMRWILGVFAMAYNRRNGLTGHVWGGRFYSQILASLREYLRIFDYIDSNPVRAGLVDGQGQWRYCGLWHARAGIGRICEITPDWLSRFLSFRTNPTLA